MNEIFVTCPSGIEELLSDELLALGIKKVRRSFCGVYVPQEMENVYLINYGSRLATRVLWPLATFHCKDAKGLYYGAREEIKWSDYLKPELTFAIDSNVKHPLLRNSLYAAQVLKDALCDSLKDAFGSRPSVNIKEPDVQLHLFIDRGMATISYDTSGTPLFKRGYRDYTPVAPLQESLAAAVLMKAGYNGTQILCDPFCGSGTLLIEAALIATKTPPGYFRKKWSFFYMPKFTQKSWLQVKERLDAQIIPLQPHTIFGADKDRKAIEGCRAHLKFTGFLGAIEVSSVEIKKYRPPAPAELIICNPPYGKRLEMSSEVYDHLGTFLKDEGKEQASALFLTPFDTFLPAGGLRIFKQFSLYNGGSKVHLYALKV